MGYSISVSAKSHRLKEEMCRFLHAEYRSWPAVLEDEELTAGFAGPLIDADLAHAAGKCAVGFDYGQVAGPEREYHYSIMRWVALKIGKHRSKFRSPNVTLERSVPYLMFDASETWPILLEPDWPTAPTILRLHVCDSLGMRMDLDMIARELAWYHIPDDTYERVTVTHQGRSVEEIQSTLIDAGFDGAKRTLRIIRSQVGRLDDLWKTR